VLACQRDVDRAKFPAPLKFSSIRWEKVKGKFIDGERLIHRVEDSSSNSIVAETAIHSAFRGGPPALLGKASGWSCPLDRQDMDKAKFLEKVFKRIN
jgi:hypothetical protein